MAFRSPPAYWHVQVHLVRGDLAVLDVARCSLTHALVTLRSVFVARATRRAMASSKLSGDVALISVTRATVIVDSFLNDCSSGAVTKEEPDPTELPQTVVIGNEPDPGSASGGQPDEVIRLRLAGRSPRVEEQLQTLP